MSLPFPNSTQLVRLWMSRVRLGRVGPTPANTSSSTPRWPLGDALSPATSSAAASSRTHTCGRGDAVSMHPFVQSPAYHPGGAHAVQRLTSDQPEVTEPGSPRLSLQLLHGGEPFSTSQVNDILSAPLLPSEPAHLTPKPPLYCLGQRREHVRGRAACGSHCRI